MREVLIYGRQVRKQARDVSRWGRRNLLRDDAPRDLGVPPDQLEQQYERERLYLAEREERRRAAGSTDDARESERGLARRLRAVRLGVRTRSMAAAAGRREVEGPPT